MNSINPLYLIIYSATGHFKEKNDEKYLILYFTDKYEEVLPTDKSEEVLSGIRSKIKTKLN